jgi:hypothetical protein
MRGGAKSRLAQAPWPNGAPNILLLVFFLTDYNTSNKRRIWESRLIHLLTYYSWPFIDIFLYCSDDRKSNC